VGILRGGVTMGGRRSLPVATVFRGGDVARVDDNEGSVLLQLREDERMVRKLRV
jgi:hypothetical protein